MNAHVLWYITRATGIVALLLLTATTVLGIVTSVRYATESWPRFAWQDLHRRLSLVAVVFVGIHVASTVLEGYAPIGWLSVLVPFTSPYRRLWLGLGTAAVDLLLAVGISSVLRNRIRARTWRALHWLSYLSWPLAVTHGLGTGTDPRLNWVLGLVVLCAGAVFVAGLWRLGVGWPQRAGLRLGAGAVGAASLVAVASWAAEGPLRADWAARAGTPPSLLRHTVAAPATAGTSNAGSSGSGTAAGTGALPSPPYQAELTGTISQRSAGSGLSEVDISGRTTGAVQALLSIRLVGSPDASGGLVMQSGSATFGPTGTPAEYHGQVVGLEGGRLTLALTDAAGAPLDLRVDLAIDGSTVQGVVSAATSLAGRDEGGE